MTAAELRPVLDTAPTELVLTEVLNERVRQHRKWGRRDHPDGTGPGLNLGVLPMGAFGLRADRLEAWARLRCQQAERDGGDTYERILTEEWAEAIAADDPAKLRAELVQVAAVAVAWVEKLDREPVTSCPECRQGKHVNCTSETLDEHDELVLCTCPDASHHR